MIGPGTNILTSLHEMIGLPILILCMPLTSTDARNVTIEPYNNFSLVDVHKEVASYIRKESVIVEDAYYLDDQSRTFLRDKGMKYLSAINPVRFKEVWVECEKKVEKKGDWVTSQLRSMR